jgi:hypothetical protein
MTDTLLCIGGPYDGRRHTPNIDGSQTLILHVRPALRTADGLQQPVEEKTIISRAIYSRESIYFNLGVKVDFWVHENISVVNALHRLIERYKGDAE